MRYNDGDVVNVVSRMEWDRVRRLFRILINCEDTECSTSCKSFEIIQI